MRDFGYSKSADETLAIWGHDEALADVVLGDPHLPARRRSSRASTRSRRTTATTRPRRSSRARRSRPPPIRSASPSSSRAASTPWQADAPRAQRLDLARRAAAARTRSRSTSARYDPRLGLVLRRARGALAQPAQEPGLRRRRASAARSLERFVHARGHARRRATCSTASTLGWARFGDARRRGRRARSTRRARALDRDRPERALPALLAAHARARRAARTTRACATRARALDAASSPPRAGLFVRATAARAGVRAGRHGRACRSRSSLRRPADADAARASRFPTARAVDVGAALARRRQEARSREADRVPADAPVSTPYWLARAAARRAATSCATRASSASREGPPALAVDASSSRIDGPRARARRAGRLRVDRSACTASARARSLIVPPATVTPRARGGAVPERQARRRSRCACAPARDDAARRRRRSQLPAGWRAEPADASPSRWRSAGDETTVRFDGDAAARRRAAVEVARRRSRSTAQRWSFREDVIDYPHIPLQVVLQPADAAAGAARR